MLDFVLGILIHRPHAHTKGKRKFLSSVRLRHMTDKPEKTDSGSALGPVPETDKRILFAVRYLWGNEGITTDLIGLVEELRSRGWDVGLIAGVDPNQLDDGSKLAALVQNTSYFYLPVPRHFSAREIYAFPILFFRLLQHIRSYEPSLIQLFSLSLAPYFYLARTLTGIRYVSRPAVEPAPSKKSIKIGRLISKAFKKYAGDHVIAISSDMVAPIRDKLGVPESQIRVILNGMDTSHFRPPNDSERVSSRDKFNVDQNADVISIVGRLHWIKGHDILFEAVRGLRDSGLTPTVLCAGSGDCEQEIRNLADDLHIADQIKFLGYTNARTVYWASDALVLPSRREGFANVIAEGMLCGTIPIRTPGAGVSDQINHGKNGFVIPFDDPEALADTIRYVFSHPEEQASIKREATEIAQERFSLERMVEKTEHLYLSTMK